MWLKLGVHGLPNNDNGYFEPELIALDKNHGIP